MDFTKYFEQYETLAAKVDEAFKRVSDAHPDLVLCKPGCTDCCFALFDLTLVEALYINHKFNKTFSDDLRESMIEKANKADRQIFKLKRAAYQSTQSGQDENAVVEDMGKKRVQCPLLNNENHCEMYTYRPLACRIYGVPMAIGGTGRTCGLSGFVKGESYPTVNMDIIHNQLLTLSTELALSIESKHPGLSEMLVPVSMAILTDYNDEYLGTVKREGLEIK